MRDPARTMARCGPGRSRPIAATPGRAGRLGPSHQGRGAAGMASRRAPDTWTTSRQFTADETMADRRVDHVPSALLETSASTTRSTSPTAWPAPAGSGSTPTTSARRWRWPCAGSGAQCRPPSPSSGSPKRSTAGRRDARAGARDRPDRIGQDDHAGRHGRPHQPHPLVSRRHHRGPGGVPPPRRPGRHRPAGGRVRHRSSPRPCGSSCARTPTSSWSARCATRRPCRPL